MEEDGEIMSSEMMSSEIMSIKTVRQEVST